MVLAVLTAKVHRGPSEPVGTARALQGTPTPSRPRLRFPASFSLRGARARLSTPQAPCLLPSAEQQGEVPGLPTVQPNPTAPCLVAPRTQKGGGDPEPARILPGGGGPLGPGPGGQERTRAAAGAPLFEPVLGSVPHQPELTLVGEDVHGGAYTGEQQEGPQRQAERTSGRDASGGHGGARARGPALQLREGAKQCREDNTRPKSYPTNPLPLQGDTGRWPCGMDC